MDQLDQQNIPHDFISVHGESRLCLNVIDQTAGTATELIEPGHEVDDEQLAQLKTKLEQLAKISSTVVISGSIPNGVPQDSYAELIRIAKQAGAKVLLDASNEPLLEGIEAIPTFIKPNEDEVKVLMSDYKDTHSEEIKSVNGVDSESDSHHNVLYDRILELNERGIRYVIVTLGARGAIAAVDGVLYRIDIPEIEAINAVGCGDSFTAGMAFGLERCYSTEETLRLAAAAGSANALHAEAGFINQEDLDRLLTQIRISVIE